MKESKFDIIVGRHHSGRTRQALSMAFHTAQRLKREVVVYGDNNDIAENGYITKHAKEIRDLFGVDFVAYDFHGAMLANNQREEYVYCVLGDEISMSAPQQEAVRQLVHTLDIYKQHTVITTPSLVGMRDDLRLSIKARAIINASPVGARIHLTTLQYEEGNNQPRLHIELIGYRMPFNI